MAEPTLLLRDGGDDLAIANAAQRLRGQPESELRWVCQHSCAEETIPGCADPNCEGTRALDDADARLVLALAAQGDLAPFDAVTLACRIAAPQKLVAALLAAGPGITRTRPAPGAKGAAELRGSLLAFARCCARIAGVPETVPGLKALGELLAEKLRVEYWNGARALLDQRFVDRRKVAVPPAPARKVPLVAFAARGQWPGIAYVAFGVDAGGNATGYDLAYGLTNSPAGAWRFARVSPGSSREPGEFYGPDCRLVLRVDAGLQAEARGIAERFAAAPATGDAAALCLDCFAEIARALALDLAAEPIPAAEKGDPPCLRPQRFLRALINRIPL